MCDNRTSEFLSLARGLPSSSSGARATTGASAAGASSDEKDESSRSTTQFSELRTFHQTAGDISRDIATTSALLAELAQLVRHKSLLKDDAAAINGLVVRIKTGIEGLNARLDRAGATLAEQKRSLGKNSQAGQEAANLVDGLRTEFAEAASGFKKVLQQRTDNLKETETMQRQVYGGGGGAGSASDLGGHDGGNDSFNEPIPNLSSSALAAPPPVYAMSAQSGADMYGGGAMGGGGGGALSGFPTIDLTSGMMAAGEASGPSPSASANLGLPRPHGISAPNSSGGIDYANSDSNMRNRRQSSMGGTDSGLATYSGSYSTMYERQHSAPQPLGPLDIARMEEESGSGQMMQLIPDQDYLRERADAMSTVESNIVELGTIFNKLAVMVSEHKEMVQRVEDNVEDANANINLSLGVLTDTLTSLKANKMLALRIFSILVAFIVFFIVFFA